MTKAAKCFTFATAMNRRDPPCHADLQIFIGEDEYALELDRDTMRARTELRRRIADYEHYRHEVLWVCPSRARVEEMKGIVRAFQTGFWFTTLAELEANPAGYIWENADGQKSSLAPQDVREDA